MALAPILMQLDWAAGGVLPPQTATIIERVHVVVPKFTDFPFSSRIVSLPIFDPYAAFPDSPHPGEGG